MKHNQNGAVNSLVISLVFAVILLIGAAGFGAWAFNSRQDYKNHTDVKIGVAVTAAKKQQNAVDAVQAAEDAKQPLETYHGAEPAGSIVLEFPKTWSAYINDTGGNPLIDAYFAPGIVPALTNPNSIFALRVQVLNQAYPGIVQSYAGQAKAGLVTINAYALPKVPQAVGVKISGQLTKQGLTTTMVILPLRSQTIELWTQTNQYLDDFNNNILANFSFSP
jgi:hypothetical protein